MIYLFIGFVTLFLCVVAHEYLIYKKMEIMGVETKEIPSLDNAIKANKEICSFLSSRSLKLYRNYSRPSGTGIDSSTVHRILSGEEMAIPQFLRICHALGCEVVVRQVGTADIETSENTAEFFEEVISKMKPQRR